MIRGLPSFPNITENPVENSDVTWSRHKRWAMQMIVEGLFIGPSLVTRDQELLDQYNIRVLVFVTLHGRRPHIKARFPHKYRYEVLELPLERSFTALSNATTSIKSILKTGQGILFYDETGNDVVAVPICAYLMETCSMNFDQALCKITDVRLSVALRVDQEYPLHAYGSWLKARESVVGHVYTDAELKRSSQRRKFDDYDTDQDSNEDGRELVHRHDPFTTAMPR